MAKTHNTWTKYIVILGLAIFLLFIVNRKNNKYEQKNANIFSAKAEEMTSFSLMKDGEGITIDKVSDTLWVFQEPDTGFVDQLKVTSLLTKTLTQLRTGYVTDKPEKYSQFNVDSTALKVTLYSGEKVLDEVFIGKSNSSWSQDYVRYPDDPKIYITQKKLLNDLNPKVDFWRKK